jgi:hypothetical protein
MLKMTLYQIFQQSKLKGCFWLLNKLTIITVAILNISLLMLDLMAEKQDKFWQIFLPYGTLLILNSKLLLCTVSKTHHDDGILIFWLVFYAASMVLNYASLALTNGYNNLIPVNSKAATEFIINSMELDPEKQLAVGFYITVFFCTIMILALCLTILVDTPEEQAILPIIVSVPIQLPVYTTEGSLPSYNEAFQDEVVERAGYPPYTTENIPPNYYEALQHEANITKS